MAPDASVYNFRWCELVQSTERNKEGPLKPDKLLPDLKILLNVSSQPDQEMMTVNSYCQINETPKKCTTRSNYFKGKL